MKTVSTNFLSDYNGTCQNDNSQYLHWRKFSQNDNRHLQWRKFRKKTTTKFRFLNSNAHESPFHHLQMTPANASHSDWFIDDWNRIRQFQFHVAILAKKENISPCDLKRKFKNWFLPEASLALGMSLPTSAFVCASFVNPEAVRVLTNFCSS